MLLVLRVIHMLFLGTFQIRIVLVLVVVELGRIFHAHDVVFPFIIFLPEFLPDFQV